MDKMKNRQILENYNQIKSIVEQNLGDYSAQADFYKIELIETIMSHSDIIRLIQQENLNSHKNKLVILAAINESKSWLRSLNYNFKEKSLDSMQENFGFELAQPETADDQTNETESLDLDQFDLNPNNRLFLDDLCKQLSSNQSTHILQELNQSKSQVNERVTFIRNLFPEIPKKSPEFLESSSITDEQLIDVYKHVLVGLLSKFPPLLLHKKAEHRIAVLVRFLRDHILNISTDQLYEDYKIEDLYKYKLANCARYVNYSWNRIVQIVEPSKYLPWQLGRVSEGYWQEKSNRIEAIRWLIEDYFNIKSNQIWKLIHNKILTRETFGKLGLSYLYNTYYNSLLKSIQEAYPELEYWEIGIYPNGYWDSDDAKGNGSRAFIWMLQQEGIQTNQLVEAIEIKWINRKLFSKYNLSTMFDYCFNKNLFDLIDFAFPKKFKPWEIGNVKQSYWNNDENHLKAVQYFLKEIHQSEFEVERLLKQDAFKKSNFKRSKLANFFKNYYNNNPDKIFYRLLKPLRIVREGNYRIYKKLQRINKPDNENRLFKFLKHGFNLHLVESFEKSRRKRIARKLRSRKYILEKED